MHYGPIGNRARGPEWDAPPGALRSEVVKECGRNSSSHHQNVSELSNVGDAYRYLINVYEEGTTFSCLDSAEELTQSALSEVCCICAGYCVPATTD